MKSILYNCQIIKIGGESRMEIDKVQDLKKVVSESLRETTDSYLIQELFHRFPTTTELMNASEEELISIKGIGKGKAGQILAMLKLSKVLAYPEQKQIVIRSPQNVFALLEPELRFEQKELFICLFLNSKNHLIFKEIISIGSLNASIVHPREVFHAAIRRCSASLICAHNHPSGDPEPSHEDIAVTKRLKAAGEIIGIDVLDHVFIGNNQFYSLKEHGHF